MDGPTEAFERIIRHRMKREAKVVAALQLLGPASPSTLLGTVYDDVPHRLHPVALRSLMAHLYKLRHDGVAGEEEGEWAMVAGGG